MTTPSRRFATKADLVSIAESAAAKYATQTSIPTATSELTNDSGYITDVVTALGYTPLDEDEYRTANTWQHVAGYTWGSLMGNSDADPTDVSTTTNYSITKPGSTSLASIDVINADMDLIDATLKSLADAIAGAAQLYAAISHAHSAADITSGILATTYGGTGSTIVGEGIRSTGGLTWGQAAAQSAE